MAIAMVEGAVRIGLSAIKSVLGDARQLRVGPPDSPVNRRPRLQCRLRAGSASRALAFFPAFRL